MSLLTETFLKNGGIAKFAHTKIAPVKIEGKNLLLFGGFIQEFAKELKKMDIDFSDSNIKREIFLLHPLHFNPYPNITHFLYEVGCEEAVIALLARSLCDNGSKSPESLESLKNLDIGYFASECNLSEEELDTIAQHFKSGQNSIIIGSDIKTHKRVENIAKILAFLSKLNIEIIFLESCENQAFVQDSKGRIEDLADLESYDGLVVYLQEGAEKEMVLESSKQFCIAGKMHENATNKVCFLDSKIEIAVRLECNATLKGMVGILWIPQKSDLQNGFCYKLISKVA